MAFQSPFGDASIRYQRQCFLPAGGLMIETGCISTATDSTFFVPTQMSECIAVVLDTADGSDCINGVPDVSTGGHITCSLTGALANGYTSYVAVGF